MQKNTASSFIIKCMGLPMDPKAEKIHNKLVKYLEDNANKLGNYGSVDELLDKTRNAIYNNTPDRLMKLYESEIKDIDPVNEKDLLESKTINLAKAAVTITAIEKVAPGVKNIVSFSDIKYAIENGV